MGFNSVFRALQEVFPQVDLRILRAVAIEHSKDADAAVEFILSEVLPFTSSPSQAPVAPNDDQEVGLLSAPGEDHSSLQKHEEEAEESNAGPSTVEYVGDEGDKGIDHTNDLFSVNPACVNEGIATSAISDLCDGKNVQQSGANSENEVLISLAKQQDVSIVLDLVSQVPCSPLMDEDTSVPDHCTIARHVDLQDLNAPVTYDPHSVTSGEICQDQLCLDANSLDAQNLLAADTCLVISSSFNEASESAAFGIMLENDAMASLSECEKQGASGLLESASEQVIFDAEMGDAEDASSAAAVVTRSGQVCRIDHLEDIISDAKNNKKTLFSAMESVMRMMREVDLHEEAAEQAKQEASKGGLNILAKVEDLKEMLRHAKEANDMHAGEVFAEKAILATEVRELQSRLLNLSEERDKSLAILEEMHQALEARLAAAEEERRAAEQEKLEKEKSAQEALAEQELAMEKVVQESKKLQQEAEENSKLRDFLIDRGHIVDILQGEIAVICQDVKLLKEKFDERVPISKSLSSSQTSCILASSSSSFKSLTTETLENTNSTPSTDGISQKTSREETVVNGNPKVLLDDEWDLFDEAELYSSAAKSLI